MSGASATLHCSDSRSIRHVAFHDEGDTAEGRLAATRFLLEATGNEAHTLWERWCGQSNECRDPIIAKWEQLGGWLITVGKINERPIAVSLDFNRLDGFLICVWEGTSELVDYKMIKDWLSQHFHAKTTDGRRAWCNASNFHHLTGELAKFKAATK